MRLVSSAKRAWPRVEQSLAPSATLSRGNHCEHACDHRTDTAIAELQLSLQQLMLQQSHADNVADTLLQACHKVRSSMTSRLTLDRIAPHVRWFCIRAHARLHIERCNVKKKKKRYLGTQPCGEASASCTSAGVTPAKAEERGLRADAFAGTCTVSSHCADGNIITEPCLVIRVA